MAIFKVVAAMAAKQAFDMGAEIIKDKTYKKMEQKQNQAQGVTGEHMESPQQATPQDMNQSFIPEPPRNKEQTVIYITHDKKGNRRILDRDGHPVRVVKVLPSR